MCQRRPSAEQDEKESWQKLVIQCSVGTGGHGLEDRSGGCEETSSLGGKHR